MTNEAMQPQYREAYGFTFSVTEKPNQILLGVALPPDNNRLARLTKAFSNMKSPLRFQLLQLKTLGALLYFKSDANVPLESLLEETARRLTEAGILPNVCPHCGQPGEREAYFYDGLTANLHPACAARYPTQEAAIEQQANEAGQSKRYGRGFLGALLGALLGGVIWVLIGMVGYIAAVAGLAIAFFAKKGYEMAGGRHGKGKVWLILAAVAIAFIASQVAALWIVMADEFKQSGMNMDVNMFLLFLPIVFASKEAVGELIGNAGLGVVFCALGAFGVLQKTHKESKAVDPRTMETIRKL